MAPSDDDLDRVAILRRRALFIASAMASLATLRPARADEPPPESLTDDAGACAPVREPTPEELTEARARFERGLELFREGSYLESGDELERAYRLVPRPKAAHAAVEAFIRAGDFERAHEIVSEHLRCVGDDEALRADRESIDAKSAVLRVVVRGPGALEQIGIDQREVPRARLEAGVRLASGRHAIVWSDAMGSRRVDLYIAAGEQHVLEIETGDAQSQPCLSPWPCLSPPRPERSPFEFVPSIGVQAAPASEAGGATLRLAPSFFLKPKLELALDLGGTLFVSDEVLTALDATVLVRGWMGPTVSLAAGCGGGVLLGPDTDSGQRAGLLITPMVEAGLAVGPARFALRAPLWLSDFDGSRWKVVDLAPQLLVGVSFADLTSEDGYE